MLSPAASTPHACHQLEAVHVEGATAGPQPAHQRRHRERVDSAGCKQLADQRLLLRCRHRCCCSRCLGCRCTAAGRLGHDGCATSGSVTAAAGRRRQGGSAEEAQRRAQQCLLHP